MPKHKPLKINNQQNKSSILEEEIAAHLEKQAKYPPSLNGIPKQQS
ncbi:MULTISPECIES: hypothetical protein [Paenibacillus]|nr:MULTISPECIES: hypothetical protein [Paenibacillus]MBU9708519.1 hypothetical protein [Paenibacillus sp. AK121]MEE4569323.1 hypothetical protein [Paenibacillus polymyxa]WPQ57677.1 hypothetical protein SKN87_04295 [Paenibacillus polymyxa]CCC83717.1 hypothetical protein PPM_0780 [Paenibacillus polymyxa M1]